MPHRFRLSPGPLLMLATALALLAANTRLASVYQAIFSPSVVWFINDGLMSVFFLLIGLELKRELCIGRLSRPAQALLPAIAALGGMVGPALIYVAIAGRDPQALHGWATASATDIAFSLTILRLCAGRGLSSLGVFLTALAIIDDLGAVLIIALFYTSHLSLLWLGAACVIVFALLALSRAGFRSPFAWLFPGAALWFAFHQCGIHPTVAGVILGLCVPLGDPRTGLLHRMERALHGYVHYLIMPVFALANAGLALGDIRASQFTSPVTLGVLFGLFAGKQLGVFGSVWAMVKLGLSERPAGAGWRQIYGVALLSGIGFTMSLFIGGLAFGGSEYFVDAKLGILAGSALSAMGGWLVLRGAKYS